MFHRRTKGKTIGQMRREVQQRFLVRGLFLNMKTKELARQMHCTVENVRDLAATPEVQTALDAYARAQFEAQDRRIPFLVKTTMDQLIRQLQKGNWKAVERICADTGLLGRLVERYLAQLAAPRGLVPSLGHDTAGVIPVQALSDEQRELARKLFHSIRNAQPNPALPAKILTRVQAIQGPDQN